MTLAPWTIVGESVKSGHRIKKWSNFAMAKPISKVVKCGQILLTGQIFRAPAARTARNTRLLFCIVHSVLDRFCDDQRPEPQLQCRHGGATTGRGELTTLDCWRDVVFVPAAKPIAHAKYIAYASFLVTFVRVHEFLAFLPRVAGAMAAVRCVLWPARLPRTGLLTET